MSEKIREMVSVTDKIWQTIKYRKRGSIFFSSDFVSKGSLDSVNKALSELTKRGDIIRLAMGIYCRPEMDQIFGLGVIYPGLDEIAEAVASRDGARFQEPLGKDAYIRVEGPRRKLA